MGFTMTTDSMQQTFAMLKPDLVGRNKIGAVLSMIEANDFRIITMRMARLEAEDVRAFYAEHKHRAFFDELCDFMLSGPCVALVLEGDHAILRWRDLMGSTDSAKAKPGTVRWMFGSQPVYRNAVHGSDGPEAAKREIALFFPNLDRV